jgi:prophage antirepressor-like protein
VGVTSCFVAADVRRILGLTPLAAPTHERRAQAGLYRLVMRSDRPEARRFQDCVVGFVVATLRRKGVWTRWWARSARTSPS